MIVRMLWTLALAAACAAPERAFAQGKGGEIDFTSSIGREKTCERYAALDAKRLVRSEDKAAWAICAMVDTVRDAATWARRMQIMRNATSQENIQRIRDKLEQVLDRVDEIRKPLEAIRGSKPLFVIRPGEWIVDWDGDGIVTPFERHLLWVPRRDVARFVDGGGFGAGASHYERQFHSPTIKVDQADVHWLLAYLNFGQAALHLVLSYEIELSGDFRIRLRDAERVRKRAYPQLLEGLRQSSALRAALTKETDDEDEWIPNPKQRRNSFPLVMDAQTFTTWGALLGHMEKLFRGQTLLGGSVEQNAPQGVRDLTMGVCRPGEGINLRDLFLNPLPELWGRDRGIARRCVQPSAAVPFSGLAEMVAESVRRNTAAPGGFSGEAMILRHFYWVN